MTVEIGNRFWQYQIIWIWNKIVALYIQFIEFIFRTTI